MEYSRSEDGKQSLRVRLAAVNGTIPYMQNLCAADSMCQGFYTCSDTVNTTELAVAIDPTLGQSAQDLTVLFNGARGFANATCMNTMVAIHAEFDLGNGDGITRILMLL